MKSNVGMIPMTLEKVGKQGRDAGPMCTVSQNSPTYRVVGPNNSTTHNCYSAIDPYSDMVASYK